MKRVVNFDIGKSFLRIADSQACLVGKQRVIAKSFACPELKHRGGIECNLLDPGTIGGRGNELKRGRFANEYRRTFPDGNDDINLAVFVGDIDPRAGNLHMEKSLGLIEARKFCNVIGKNFVTEDEAILEEECMGKPIDTEHLHVLEQLAVGQGFIAVKRQPGQLITILCQCRRVDGKSNKKDDVHEGRSVSFHQTNRGSR